MSIKYREVSAMRSALLTSAAALPIIFAATGALAAPAIRTDATNRVPACVTPERLMAFLTERNDRLDPRFRGIALYYKHYGEGWRVRWDYAFFQMAIETNFLKFRRGDGKRGDVRETQNNFAGIGATGGGVPGERFADVQTGVHAQIQHLVAYSGEHLAAPVAKRTREQQSGIIHLSLRLGRPVTFGDLARRWATDRNYAKSIDFIANSFAQSYCNGAPVQTARDTVPPAPQPAQRRRALPFPPPSGLGGPKPSEIEDQSADIEIAADAEELPWLAKPKPAHTDTPARPASSKPKPAPGKQKPAQQDRVKTIWSRDAVIQSDGGSQDAPSRNASGDPALDRNTAESTTSPAPAAPSGLPVFKITPSTGPEPSRLGGPVPDIRNAPANSKPCRILMASYGGTKTLLLRSETNGETQLTALTVLDGFEKSMFETYRRVTSPAAEIVGEYADKDSALADARSNCPTD
ncbi:glucosaminidase domain-containing protein [Hyphomicrobium methylovorum]|uniref:glucosaminidase domain-containing protein n=1 Tax=Hyphomicrobium methylovorum TaxID=84 RepID=UPI0015E69F8A|nr:glucosaminidase domain-containing protein [Hyphomicrobium methylovorum]